MKIFLRYESDLNIKYENFQSDVLCIHLKCDANRHFE